MPQVSIAREALRELRQRIGRFATPAGVLITGPLKEDPRAPSDLEEAWALERLYGPPQRWVLDIRPLSELAEMPFEPGANLFSENVAGIHVKLLTTQAVDKLRVELRGENIRIYEDDV